MIQIFKNFNKGPSDRELIEVGAGFLAYFYDLDIPTAFEIIEQGFKDKVISRKELIDLYEFWEFKQFERKLEKHLEKRVK